MQGRTLETADDCVLTQALLERSKNMSNKAYIKDGKLFNMSIQEYFTVQIHTGDVPQIGPNIVLDHMPVKVAQKLIHEALKVRGRGPMRIMSAERLKKVYSGDVSWRVLFSKAGADEHKIESQLDDAELDAKIAELQAKRAARKDDFDQAVEDAENDTENDETE